MFWEFFLTTLPAFTAMWLIFSIITVTMWRGLIREDKAKRNKEVRMMDFKATIALSVLGPIGFGLVLQTLLED